MIRAAVLLLALLLATAAAAAERLALVIGNAACTASHRCGVAAVACGFDGEPDRPFLLGPCDPAAPFEVRAASGVPAGAAAVAVRLTVADGTVSDAARFSVR